MSEYMLSLKKSKERETSRARWRLSRRQLSFVTLLFLSGVIALLVVFYNRPLPSYVPSYGGRKLEFKLVTRISAPQISFNGTYLLILVTSAPSNFDRRDAIRSTWARRASLRMRRQPFYGIRDWNVVFMLGKADSTTNTLVEEEAREFNDILVGEFQDLYENLVIKTFMGFLWASRVKCTHVLKADDDVYVHIPRLITWLRQPSLPPRLYAGQVNNEVAVDRSTSSKYFLDRESYAKPFYPPYCAGPFYILSKTILPELINLTSYIKPVLIEDTYIGMLTRSLGITLVDLTGNFSATLRGDQQALRQHDCVFASSFCLGHNISPSGMFAVHSRYMAMDDLTQEERRFVCLCAILIFTGKIVCFVTAVIVMLYFFTHRL